MSLASHVPAAPAGQRAALILAASKQRAAEVETLLEQIRQYSGHQAAADVRAGIPSSSRDVDDVTEIEGVDAPAGVGLLARDRLPAPPR